MGTSPSPCTHGISGAASAVGEGRKDCLFLEMPFTAQAPSTRFYSAASYTRHQTSPRLLRAESFPRGESCLDLPCVFQSISPVRHADKLKQADFDRAQKENSGGSARHRRTVSPCSPPFPVEIREGHCFPSSRHGDFLSHWHPQTPMRKNQSAARRKQLTPLVAGWGGDGELHDQLQARVGTLLLM